MNVEIAMSFGQFLLKVAGTFRNIWEVLPQKFPGHASRFICSYSIAVIRLVKSIICSAVQVLRTIDQSLTNHCKILPQNHIPSSRTPIFHFCMSKRYLRPLSAALQTKIRQNCFCTIDIRRSLASKVNSTFFANLKIK